MTHFVYLKRIKRANCHAHVCIDARLPDTIVSGAIVCKITKATETTDVSVSASVYTRPMISCVHIHVCLPNRSTAPFTPPVHVVVRTNCAIAYMSLRDNATVRYARSLQPRMHLSASQEVMRSDICIASTGLSLSLSLSLPPFFRVHARSPILSA